MERFAPGRLFEDQLEPPSSPLYWILGGIFLVLLLGSLYIYLQAAHRYGDDRFHVRLARRFAAATAVLSGVGLAATAFALLALPFLSKRIWIVLPVPGLVVLAGYGLYYRRRRYAAARASHIDLERRRRSVPRPKGPARRRRGRRSR